MKKSFQKEMADQVSERIWTVVAVIAGAAMLLVCLLGSCGCSAVRAYDKGRQAGFSAIMPAWPWQDSARVIERMNVSSKTNGFTASIRGLNDTEVTSTNAAALIESVSKGAIEGAISALKKP